MKLPPLGLAALLLVASCGGLILAHEAVPGDDTPGMAGIGVLAAPDGPKTSGHARLRDHLVIKEVLAGGPAAKGGLKVGDEIVAIDGAKLAGRDFAGTVSNLLRGSLGTAVTLTIARAGEAKSFNVVLVRDIVPVNAK